MYILYQFRFIQVKKHPGRHPVILLDKPDAVWREPTACGAGRVFFHGLFRTRWKHSERL